MCLISTTLRYLDNNKKKRIKDKTCLIGGEGDRPCLVCLHRWITQHVMKEGETVREEAKNW